MAINPRKYIEVDKRFPDTMSGDGGRILTVKNDESGYEHNPNIVFETLVGAVIMWPLDTPPQGYLICDGAEYDIATYPNLGALLGENAPGSGKFNVPNISFAKNSAGVNTLMKEPDRVGEHTHNIDEVGNHVHSVTVNAVANHSHYVRNTGAHQHSMTVFQGQDLDAGGCIRRNDCGGPSSSAYTNNDGIHRHDMDGAGAHGHSASAGEGGSHNHKIHAHNVGKTTQPECTLLNFCIRT